MAQLKRVPGSLRAEGQVMLSIHKSTGAAVRQLAGDMPMCDYVRHLVLRELAGKQGALPGQELAASKNTLPALKSDTEQTLTLVRGISEFMSGFLEPWTVFQNKNKQAIAADDIETKLRWLADMVKKDRPVPDQQRELQLG